MPTVIPEKTADSAREKEIDSILLIMYLHFTDSIDQLRIIKANKTINCMDEEEEKIFWFKADNESIVAGSENFVHK